MALWTVERKDGIEIATYNNPPMNYFCAEAVGEFQTLIESWRDPAVRVVILTGALPGRFITHYSVEELHALASDRAAMIEAGPAVSAGYHALLMSLRQLPKPIIAAINGDTMGGGFELAMSCDIRIMAQGDHRIGLPEVRLGILPGGTGTQVLSRMIGLAKAIEFILRGRIVKPDEAAAIGLVHEVAADPVARAIAMARDLIAQSPVALAAAKRAVYDGADLELSDGLKIESEQFLIPMTSDEGLKVMADYLAQPLEKRRDWLETPE